ncbi:zincin, partial [Sporormia fimetaria CBS 119925]
MLIARTLSVLVTAALAVVSSAAGSTSRNPLKSIDRIRNPTILTQNNRVTALSSFDLVFDTSSSTRIRLSLEPNHDIFPEGAAVQYVAADGTITRREPIDRLAHKVFMGTAWIRRGQRWDKAGWARVTVAKDGVAPLFEGAFTIFHDHHHVQLSRNYKNTRQDGDPDIDLRDEEFMVLFRDSDIADGEEHTELRKRQIGGPLCGSDELKFNVDPQHPVYEGMRKRSEGWMSPISPLLAKRQVDPNMPGGGNGAGVNLVSTIGSTEGCPSTRKVALVGVAVDCNYRARFPDEEATRQNVINQMNAASSLFERTFSISLGLANLIIVESQCPTTVQQATPWNQACSNNINIKDRLNLFSRWRGQQNDGFSHWTLLSTCQTESSVGLAWLGQACAPGSQPNGNQDEFVAGANVVIRTTTEWQVIAHETGHTFGAVHDCTTSACRDSNFVNAQQCCQLSSDTCDAGERFIMNPSTAQGINEFSACTVGNICSALGRNSVKSNCFTNNRNVLTVTGQTCGNGIVEGDEECDCGGPEGCGDNQCCDPGTCRFRNNAVCDDSNEDCCRGCQFASKETVCRASSGSCDPEETCTGDSPYCPEDKTEDDGADCGDGLQCASGQCTSRDMQCKVIMGSYTQGNVTYACDNNDCMLSCASPEFGANVCYGLRQNFLDGTPCGAGGKCQNGQCGGSSVGNEVKSWISRNKNVVIGVAAGVGGLVLILFLVCLCRCCGRSRKKRKMKKAYAAGM